MFFVTRMQRGDCRKPGGLRALATAGTSHNEAETLRSLGEQPWNNSREALPSTRLMPAWTASSANSAANSLRPTGREAAIATIALDACTACMSTSGRVIGRPCAKASWSPSACGCAKAGNGPSCTAASAAGSSNRIAADDNPVKLMSIAVKPLAGPPFPLEGLVACASVPDAPTSRGGEA